ncbi:MAG TPA: hypothetical protein VD928_01405 [Candidatus Paceibacterota bacterium]|nr:hypothetical protein [Candidatus Paceibacterota bacterium]
MDELEISGKRYISTRRAGKEYKYHSDYIGQLIRGKKLVGTKVGRSWYVEATSLSEYFGKEMPAKNQDTVQTSVGARLEQSLIKSTAVEPEQVNITPKVAEVKPVVEITTPIDRKEEIKISTPAPVSIRNVNRDSIHIPIRKPSFESPKKVSKLRYISDDTPVLPKINKASIPISTTLMPKTLEEVQGFVPEISNKEDAGNVFRPVLGIAAVGALILIGITMSSILVSSHITKEAGQPASVEYSLH